MKVEELMIGDWIIGPDLEPKRVVAILNFDEIQVEEEPDSDTWITYSISDVEPIPLKGWMLTRSGFRRYEKEEWQNWPMENWQNDITLRSIVNLEPQPLVAPQTQPGRSFAAQTNTATPSPVTETPTGEFQF